MNEPSLELADIIRQHGKEFRTKYGDRMTAEQRRVLRDLARCRTAELGGHIEECDRCGHRIIAYNSCRNRHCPKCRATARMRWLEKQLEAVLPVDYHHVVFTLPDALNPLVLQNRRLIYGLLFQCTAESLLQIAADPKHLGAEIGFLAVLHTWGQTLQLHPHIHCVVPGGGLSFDRTRWISCRCDFFLPVRVLSRLFRGKFLHELAVLYQDGKLHLNGDLKVLKNPIRFHAWLEELRQIEWVVYSKPPFGGPEQVLKYLARYTHRVAISNGRLLRLQDGKVTFAWKDYADEGKSKEMTLDAVEFIRRFLLHTLPSGFVHIRHYGFLCNRRRTEAISLCRQLIALVPNTELIQKPLPQPTTITLESLRKMLICPHCSQGKLVVVAGIVPYIGKEEHPEAAKTLAFADTS